MFEKASFIKPDTRFIREYRGKNPAPMFRKKFKLNKFDTAVLSVCGLGYGYYYINGEAVSEDLFTAPVSDYDKTLWYNTYVVSHLLKEGENIISVILGNGWFNEEFKTSWNYDAAPWRDLPKFILQLDADGETVLVSEDSWLCKEDSAVVFNALRSGEYFDSNLYEEKWNKFQYDDSDWKKAAADCSPPTGIFRECKCEPIREHDVYDAIEIYKTGDEKYVFDMGQNMSGYIRLTVCQNKGDKLIIRYAEQLKEDLSLELNMMDKHYKDGTPFQTDMFICSGKKTVWSPKFVYHGFRYIEIDGIKNIDDITVQAVFVHQAVEKKTEFNCSDEFLNKLFKAGQASVYSNMFYSLTDCPTREKLGWTNDAQASAEQVLTNFKAERFFEKWLTDIYDAMKPDGSLPGIIPTSGWGYQWGNGPVSDGVLFEIPYRLYLHTGDGVPLINSLPYFDRYLAYLKTRENEKGFVDFGLDDWTNPEGKRDYNREFINAVLVCSFYEKAAFAARLAKKSDKKYQTEIKRLRSLVADNYIDADGRCILDEQTPVAMLIYHNIYDDLKPLKLQLKALVEKADFHHNCGMVGIRRLYGALNKCGLEEYAYKIITAKGFPSYRTWIDSGATTLWEMWNYNEFNHSRNHHMYSDFMSWMIKTIAGVAVNEKGEIHVNPYFFDELDFAYCECFTNYGSIEVKWKKTAEGIKLDVNYNGENSAYFRNELLNEGTNTFLI